MGILANVATKEEKENKCINKKCSDGSNGASCFWDSECDSGLKCDGNPGKCSNKRGKGESCNEKSDCISKKCIWDKCSDGSNGASCSLDSHCNSGRCDGALA